MNIVAVLQLGISYVFYAMIAYHLLLFGYRITLHPLRNYPGPLLARLTNAYGGYYGFRRCLHLVTFKNHQTYGPVVRQGPDRLVFKTVTALHDIFPTQRFNKNFIYEITRSTAQGSIFDTVDVEEHRRKRRIISLPITEKSTRAFEPIMTQEINEFTKQIQESMDRSESINMTDRCQNLSVDVIVQLAFGYPLNLQTKEDSRWLLPGLRIAGHRNNTYMQFPKLKVVEPLLKFLGRKSRQKYLDLMATMIKYRLSLPKDARRDLYSFAINHMDLSSGLRVSELWAEAFFFIIAGSTTPSTVTSAMFFYLSRCPESRRRLTEEIRSVFSSADAVASGDKLRSCKYLHACINETLRIATPDTAIFWREAVDVDEKGRPFTSAPVVDGHTIPKGTSVGVNLYSLHHNEKYFPDPFIFKPERWLDEAENEDSIMHKAFAPFLLGARSCAGRAFAFLEISLTIAKTVWLFNFETAPGQLGKVGGGEAGRIDGRGRPEEFQLYDIFTAVHDGPYLVFSPRD